MMLYGFSASGGDGEKAGYAPGKTKRKDLEEAYNDFSEFSLSSPARKIRRLDAKLTPIMVEEEEVDVPHVFGQPMPEEQLQPVSQEMADGFVEVHPPLISNEERAIVPYKPVYAPRLDFPSSSDVLLKVDPDVIAGIKGRGFWSGRYNMVNMGKTREEEGEASTEEGRAASGSCLAVVPWVSSRRPGAALPPGVPEDMSELVAGEAMVSEDIEAASMDVEEEGPRPSGVAAPGPGMVATEDFQHWQQHCMVPQISPSNPAPIVWSWGY